MTDSNAKVVWFCERRDDGRWSEWFFDGVYSVEAAEQRVVNLQAIGRKAKTARPR